MWIQTHYYLAGIVHEHIKEKYGIELKLDSLQYGSVKPDFFWENIKVQHYYEDSAAFFKEEAAKIRQDKRYHRLREFSGQLGVLLHFTADYLCFAHNEEHLKTALWSHFNYEIALHQCFLNYTPGGIAIPQINSPEKFLAAIRKKYQETPHSMEKDVEYITAAALRLADTLTEAVILPAVQVA